MASRWRFPLIPLLITLLAAALQFWALEAQSLWYDEGFSVWLAKQPPSAIIEITAADIQPPLYYLLLNGWIALTGQSEYALRFLSAIFAVLCVPLMWQLARRLTRQPLAGTFSSLFVALSPLWLWYGREVRNYALLLAILLACAYFLLRLFEEENHRTRTPFTIAFLLIIGLYTHYFMLFVVAAWGVVGGLYALLNLKTRLHPVLLAFGLPLVLYAPWLGIMLTRLGEDRSYWEGQLNITDALTKTLASWVAGHTVLEAEAIRWGFIGLGLAGIGIGILFWNNGGRKTQGAQTGKRKAEHTANFLSPLFLSAWLILPIISYLAVALNRPKFNARYLIFSAPAFWLAIVVLVVWLWRKNRVLGAVLMGIILFSQLQATYNLYTDSAFAKANWRDVAAYIQAHRAPDERVVLVSGHTYPMTDYYLPDVEIVPLPPERTLDTSAIVGVADAPLLAEAMAGIEGVWLINWQDEVVDPEGVVPAWVTMQGGEPQEVPLFQEVRLSHWAFATNAIFAPDYAPQNPLEVRFEDALALKGWSVLPTPNPADDGLAVQLFWSAQRPMTEDYKIRLRVVDDEGFEYGTLDQRPTSYNLPTFRWEPNELRLANLEVPLLGGTPPGDYWVELSVYEEGSSENLDILDSANAPQGQQTRVGRITVDPPARWWIEGAGAGIFGTLPVDKPLVGDWIIRSISPLPNFGQGLETGQRLRFYLWLIADPDQPLTEMTLEWRRDEEWVPAGYGKLVNYGWHPEERILVPVAVQAPREAGTWELIVTGIDGAGNVVSVPLKEVEFATSEHNFNPPAPAVVQSATFGDAIRLLGYDVNEGENNTVEITLHWESLVPLDKSYTAFVHLLDVNGVIIPDAGQDKLPLNGARLTDSWVEGEYISDTFILTIPATGYTTPYQIEIGWYDANDPAFPRLPAIGDGADANRVLLQVDFP
jgi:mannosyltransferase